MFVNCLSKITTDARQYRLTKLQQLQYVFFAAGFLFLAGLFVKIGIDPDGAEVLLVLALLFLIPSVILISLTLRSRLVIDGDRIELRSALRTFTATRNEIEGLRKIDNQYGRWTRILLKDGRGAFSVSEAFTGNDDLRKWLKGLPDLDKRDAAQIRRQLGSSESLGNAASGRLHPLKQAKVWMIGLSIAVGIAAILSLFDYPSLHLPSTVLLALFPPLGILLVHRFPLLFTIAKTRVDPRSDMGIVVLLPGLAMMLSYKTGSDSTHLVEFFQLLAWYLLGLACYIAALFRIAWEKASRWGALAALLFFGGIYSIGAINAANTVLDRSVPLVYRTEVLKRYETHGRHASSYLRLAPWGPIADSDDMDVPRHMYQRMKVGDQVCLGLHPGFLRAPWYKLIPCDH